MSKMFGFKEKKTIKTAKYIFALAGITLHLISILYRAQEAKLQSVVCARQMRFEEHDSRHYPKRLYKPQHKHYPLDVMFLTFWININCAKMYSFFFLSLSIICYQVNVLKIQSTCVHFFKVLYKDYFIVTV